MSDIVTQPDTSPDVHTYRMPDQRGFADAAPIEVSEAAQAIAQQAYLNALSAPDLNSYAVEADVPVIPMREATSVIAETQLQYGGVAAEQPVQYAHNDGTPVNPSHAASVLADVHNIINSSPEALAAKAAQQARERHEAAVGRAPLYANLVEDLRDRVLISDTEMSPN